MTEEVAQTIERVLEPAGVAVVIEAKHCATRGIHHDRPYTKHLSGVPAKMPTCAGVLRRARCCSAG